MQNSERESASGFIRFIAYLQIIGIIFVVLGHSFHEHPDGDFGRTLLLYRMMYSFRMPVFMFVSGFLMVLTTRLRKSGPVPLFTFIKSKAKRLLLPFVVLTLVTFVPRVALSGIADDTMTMSPSTLLRALTYNGEMLIPYFWFLQASFIMLVFTYACIVVADIYGIRDRYLYAALLLLFIVLPLLPFSYPLFFSLNECVRLGFFFVAGATYCRYAKKVDAAVPWTSPVFMLASAGAWTALFFMTEHTPWMPLCSSAGIAMCISFAKILEKSDIQVLDHLFGANYLIFLLSWYCNVACQQVLHHYTDFPWWVYTILSLTSGVYIPWLGYRYLQRHRDSRWIRLCALLLGQSFRPAAKQQT